MVEVDLRTFAGLGGFPIVVGAVQLIKSGWPTLPAWGVTVAALVVSEVWSALVAVALGLPVLNAALIGVIVWLMAQGAWSGGKTLVRG